MSFIQFILISQTLLTASKFNCKFLQRRENTVFHCTGPAVTSVPAKAFLVCFFLISEWPRTTPLLTLFILCKSLLQINDNLQQLCFTAYLIWLSIYYQVSCSIFKVFIIVMTHRTHYKCATFLHRPLTNSCAMCVLYNLNTTILTV